MPCCSRTTGQEPEAAPILDVSILEAGEHSVKVGFSMPSRASTASSSSSSWWWPWGIRGDDDIEFKISVFGGPNSDIYGPKEESVQCRRGRRVVHEVRGLVPDTEYTVEVLLSMAGPSESHSRPVRGTVEVRTAAASTAQFAEEDWGRSAYGKYGKGGKSGDDKGKGGFKQVQETGTSSSTASSSQSPGPQGGLASLRVQPPRSLSGDECSTVAPSDVGEVCDVPDSAQDRQDEGWDPAYDENTRSEAASPQREVTTEADLQIEFAELTTSSAQNIQCNLCNMMDCLKLVRKSEPSKPSGDPTEIVMDADTAEVQPVEAQTPPPSSQRRPGSSRRPYRPTFPGTAVDPASVGLELLPALNASQLQAVIDDRTRNASRARGV